jgi:ABC-type dipeptide/oligopeptide/nickel transport system permease component
MKKMIIGVFLISISVFCSLASNNIDQFYRGHWWYNTAWGSAVLLSILSFMGGAILIGLFIYNKLGYFPIEGNKNEC